MAMENPQFSLAQRGRLRRVDCRARIFRNHFVVVPHVLNDRLITREFDEAVVDGVAEQTETLSTCRSTRIDG